MLVTGAAAMMAGRLAVMFTSGTTSEPKGVVLTQRNYHHLSLTMSELVGLRPEHRWFVTLPMFHGNAQFYCCGPAIAVGESVALTSTFPASGWFRQAAALRVTHASLFAAPIRMILARATPPTPCSSRWSTCGSRRAAPQRRDRHARRRPRHRAAGPADRAARQAGASPAC